jgi:hypothetical protein
MITQTVLASTNATNTGLAIKAQEDITNTNKG